jgi:hypothetical protein
VTDHPGKHRPTIPPVTIQLATLPPTAAPITWATESRHCTPGSRRGGPEIRAGGRGTGTERVKQLALDEAYREVAVGDDGEARMMPVIRAQLALAAKGHKLSTARKMRDDLTMRDWDCPEWASLHRMCLCQEWDADGELRQALDYMPFPNVEIFRGATSGNVNYC